MGRGEGVIETPWDHIEVPGCCFGAQRVLGGLGGCAGGAGGGGRGLSAFPPQPMEIFVDDETKLTLHGLQQYYVKLKDNEKNRKLFDLLDVLEFNQVRGAPRNPPRNLPRNPLRHPPPNLAG